MGKIRPSSSEASKEVTKLFEMSFFAGSTSLIGKQRISFQSYWLGSGCGWRGMECH